MIDKFLKLAGVKTEAEFYKKYPTEASFFSRHPELLQAGGYSDPWQFVYPQQMPQRPTSYLNTLKVKPGPSENTPPFQPSETPIYDLDPRFGMANNMMDLIGGIKTQLDNGWLDRSERAKMYELIQPVNFKNTNQYGSGNGVLGMTGQVGGFMPSGGDRQPNVIAEQNEMYERDGNVYHIDPNMPGAERHEQGGTPVNADRVLEATSTMAGRNQVTDKLLQVKPNVVEALTGFKPKKTLSHATALKKADEYWREKEQKLIGKTEKLMNDPKADKYALESARLNSMFAGQMPTTLELFDKLFHHQEMIKQLHGIGEEANYAAPSGAQTGRMIRTTSKSGIKVAYEDGFGRPLEEIKRLPMYGENTGPMPFKPVALPNPPQTKKITYQKIYNPNGALTGYAPVFSPGFSYHDAMHAMNMLPADFNGIPVIKGQAWQEMWNGVRQGTDSSQWMQSTGKPSTERVPTEWFQGNMMPWERETVMNMQQSYQAGGNSAHRKMFNDPNAWMADVPLFDMMNLSKANIPYIESQVHDAQYQTVNPTNAYNRINADYNTSLNNLPAGGVGMSGQAQLFANKTKADNEISDRISQFNAGISNQNVQAHQQFQNQYEANRTQALQNFHDRYDKRNAAYDVQRQTDRDQWLKNRQNVWATDFAINTMLPAMYPFFNYDGSYSGKQMPFNNNASNYRNGNGVTLGPDGKMYQIGYKPTIRLK